MSSGNTASLPIVNKQYVTAMLLLSLINILLDVLYKLQFDHADRAPIPVVGPAAAELTVSRCPACTAAV